MTPETRGMLHELSEAFGIPGYEDDVRSAMAKRLETVAEISYDRLGSLIARKVGAAGEPRVMLPAHMDEVGLMIRHITSDGFLRFVPVGGWWWQVMLGQRWVIRTRKGDVTGYSGARAPHLLSDEERKRPTEAKDMFLDIGAKDQQQALDMGVRPGDPVVHFTQFADLGNGRLLGKAWDDRVGCAMVIEVVRQLAGCNHPNTVYAVGTTQEEAGLLGAQTSAFAIAPQVAIVAEVAVAGDVPGSTQDGSYAELGKGVALCIRDAGLIPNRRLREFVAGVAEEVGLPTQYVTMERGTTDGTRVQVYGEGVPTLYIGPPTRYIHSHAGLIDVNDFDSAVKLLVEVTRRLDQETVAGLTRY
jgi:putative aminopeptidase FrvX